MKHIYVEQTMHESNPTRYNSNQNLHKSDQNFPSTFSSITEALQSIPLNSAEEITIHLASGIYNEKLVIQIPYLHIIGDSANNTKITYKDAAYDQMIDGTKRGTFRSYTVFIDTHDFTATNLTIENSAGNGDLVGQAIAVYADGDRIFFDHCHLIGNQDTLFTGPLPPIPYEPNGFVGPKEFAPRINGRQYYRNCLIEGTIDYIFGSATAYFESCTLYTKRKDFVSDILGYVTAASTPEGQPYGYVFFHCHFTGNCPDASVYLGRPWRDFAKTVLLDCNFDSLIHPDLFHDWNKPNARIHSYFALDCSHCPSISEASFVHILTEQQKKDYTKEMVLAGWVPE